MGHWRIRCLHLCVVAFVYIDVSIYVHSLIRAGQALTGHFAITAEVGVCFRSNNLCLGTVYSFCSEVMLMF